MLGGRRHHRIAALSFLFALLLAAPLYGKPPKRKRKRSKKVKAPIVWVMAKVKKGDSLSRLAKRHRVTIKQLRRLNRLKKGQLLHPGKRLRIKEREKRTADHRAARRGRKTPHRPKSNTLKRRGGGQWVTHKVRRGDSLWRLAARYDVSIKTIKKNNRMRRRVRLRKGMVLKIKRRLAPMLTSAVKLPRKGPGYISMRPTRSYGTPGSIRILEYVYARMAERHPGTAPGMVADLSRKDGGQLRPHKSHRRGVDVDVSYYKKGNARTRGLEIMTPETLDVDKSWDLIRVFINTGHVTAIFMDYELQRVLHGYLVSRGYGEKLLTRILQYPRAKRERRGLIRHSPGHHHHLHLRFDCVRPSDPCRIPKTDAIPYRSLRQTSTPAPATAPAPVVALAPRATPAPSAPPIAEVVELARAPRPVAAKPAAPPVSLHPFPPADRYARSAHEEPHRRFGAPLVDKTDLQRWRESSLTGPPRRRAADAAPRPTLRGPAPAARLPRFGAALAPR